MSKIFRMKKNTNQIAMAYSYNIRRLRKQRDWTQEVLAEKLDIAASYLSELENGSKQGSFDMLYKLCSVFEVEAYELFLPPNKSVNTNTKRTEQVMKMLRQSFGDMLDALESYFQET